MTARSTAGTGRAVLAILLAASVWGTIGAVQELGAPEAQPASVAAVRSVGGAAVLVAGLAFTGRLRQITVVLTQAAGPAIGAGLAITTFQLGYLGSVRTAGVAVGALVSIGSAPVFAGVFSWLSGRRPGWSWVAGTALTVVGAACLVLPGGERHEVSVVGVALGIGAGLSYATYTWCPKRAIERGVAGTPVMAVVFSVAGLSLVPVLVATDLSWLTTGRGLAAAAWLAFIATGLTYAMFARGLRDVDAATATTLTLAEPVSATVLAVVVLSERFDAVASVGLVLLGLGLVLASRPDPRRVAAFSSGSARR